MRSSDRIHDAFDSVRAGEELKAATKAYLKEVRRKSSSGRFADTAAPVFRRMLGIVCAMLVLFLGIGGYTLLRIPVSYVSIDVNPSIELALNRLNRVISAEAYNEDGERILNAVSVKGMYYTDAVERMVESEEMQPYLSENAGLTFTVAAESGQRESTLLVGVENTSGCREHGGVGFAADIGIVQEAHENGLSLGKYAAYQVLSGYDSSITAEDCHNMTMSEIHGLIEEHEHGREEDVEHGYEEDVGHGYEEDVEHSYEEDVENGYEEDVEHDGHGGHGSGHGHK